MLGRRLHGSVLEDPTWPQFYNLGNLPPYSYNLTLAKQDLTKSNITNIPPITFTTIRRVRTMR